MSSGYGGNADAPGRAGVRPRAGAPLRVLHVSSDVGFAGAGRHLETLLTAADAWDGFALAVACPAGRLQQVLAGHGIETLTYGPGNRSFSAGQVAALYRLIRQWRPHIVHTHGSLSGRLAGRLAGRRVVYTKHGLGQAVELSVQVRQRVPLLQRLADRWLADRVIAVSGAVRDELLRQGTPPSRIAVIPNGVPAPADGGSKQREALRRELGLGPGPVALSTGRLAPEKGHPYLIEAWAAVRQAVPEAVLLIAGDGPERPRLEQLIADRGLTGAVRLLGFRDDAAQLPAAADVFVLPSLTEGMGIALLEAMACGCPVIASAVGGITEAVADRTHGLLVPPGDAAGLADACIALLADPARARAYGEAAREHVLERFSAVAQARAVAALYQRLAGRGED